MLTARKSGFCLALLAPALLLGPWTSPVRAGLTFYSSQSTFASGNPNLPTETFESAQVAQGSFAITAGPLNSTTNNGVFSTGSIQSGISFASVGPYPNTNLVVDGAGTTPGSSKAVGVFSANALEISLANATSIGMNLFASAGPGSLTSASFLVQVFGASGLLGSEMVSSSSVNTFFGVSAGSTAITKVDITENGGNASTFVDNVSFGKPSPGTTYTDRTAFLLAHPGLSTEGFESAQVAQGGFALISSPLNSTSSNAAFSPGNLLPGLTIASVGSDPNTSLVALGAGTTTGGSKEVGVVAFLNSMELTFDQAQSAVGFTLLTSTGPGAPGSAVFDISIYGASGLIEIDKVSVSGLSTFFGIAEAQGITRIDISEEGSNSSVLIDDVTFTPSATVAAVPEPSSLAMAFLGLTTVLVVRSRARRVGLGG